MRRITLWLMVTATIVVLLFSYHTSAGDGTTTAAVTVAEASSVAPSTAAAPAGAAASAQTVAFTGDAVDTRYGPVQVQITVTNGQVTAAAATEVPETNGKDRQINSRAVPVLEKEAISAQNADIDMVSGATYTSEGYIQSLQSALDQANLG